MSSAEFPDAGSRFAERRAVPRFAFDAHAEMSDPLVNLRALGRVTEISRGGCFVVAPDRPTVSSVIQLRIEKDSQSLSTWARVIYERPDSGAGFHFIAHSARSDESARGLAAPAWSPVTLKTIQPTHGAMFALLCRMLGKRGGDEI